MVSLVDVAPNKETVEVNGKPVPVAGISAQGIAWLIEIHPEIMSRLFAGKSVDLKPGDLMKLGPKIIASIIAAGTGHIDEPNETEAAASLALGDQLDLLAAIIRKTFPRGVGPFVAQFEALAAQAAASGWEAGTKSPALSKD